MKTIHRLTALLLAVLLCLSLTPGLALAESPKRDDDRLRQAVEAYLYESNQLYGEEQAMPHSWSAAINRNLDRKADGLAELEERLRIELLQSRTEVQILDDYTERNSTQTVLYAYVTVFIDYDDLTNGRGGSDLMGYGTYHKITARNAAGRAEIISDEFDESDLFGVCTVTEATLASLTGGNAFFVERATTELEEAPTKPGDETAYTRYSAYKPYEAASYADRYWSNYNPAYANFNGSGGDCANFTSQCIHAGGMPMVNGAQYGTDGWFYYSSTNRSGTWTSAPKLRTWMGNNRGALVTASDSSVYVGSPVFYASAHAAICVGTNSAGRPIVNSHNNDRYHVLWNYYGGSSMKTAQLTASQPTPHSATTLSVTPGASNTETKFFWTKKDDATSYNLRIWKDVLWEGADYYTEWGLTGTSFQKVFPAGNYVAYVDTIYGSEVVMSNTVSFTVAAGQEGKEMTSGYDRVLPDGYYMIVSAEDPSYYLDISGSVVPAADDTNVVLWQRTGMLDLHDTWTLRYSDGFYTIEQRNTNIRLEVTNALKSNGANVAAHSSTSSSGQKWAISKNSSGTYKLQAKCSGFCLDIKDANFVKGENVQTWEDNGTKAQAWLFIPYQPKQTLAEGRYVILSGVDSDFEVDLPGNTGDLEAGANVQLWRDDVPSQYNSFDVEALDNGYYVLTNAASGLVLSSYGEGTASGYNVALDNPGDSPTNQWAITASGDGYVLWNGYSGMVMDLTNSKAENGTNIRRCYYNGSSGQVWKFVKAEHTVKFSANGGSNAPAQQTKYYHNALTLPDESPTRKRYRFLGWSEDRDATTATWQPGDSFTADKDTTLYAVWEGLTADILISETKVTLAKGTELSVPIEFMGDFISKISVVSEDETVCTASLKGTKWVAFPNYCSTTLVVTGISPGQSRIRFNLISEGGVAEFSKSILVEITEHAFGEPVYVWSEDLSSVTATRVCLDDASVVETETAETVSEITLPATCNEVGETTYRAVFENAAFAEQIRVEADVPALGHNWDGWEQTTNPDCETTGEETRVCLRCGESETREVAPLGHIPAEPVKENEQAPTCTEAGTCDEVTCCSICGKELSREAVTVEALGHDWGEWEQTAAPDCVTKGAEAHICRRCGKLETREVAPLGHYFTKVEAVAPTVTKPGSIAYYFCTRCGKLYRDEAGTQPISLADALVPPTGDMNGDHRVSVADVRLLFARVSGSLVPIVETAKPDVNDDGRINNRDALLLFRRTA